MEFDLYTTTELIAIIESIRVAGNFLRTLFFGGAIITFDTPSIMWDRVFDDLRIAPYVSPYSPGKPRQDKGYQTESFTPGYLKPLDRVSPDKFQKRRPGEAIGGELTLVERRDMMIADYLSAHKKQIARREEVQAAQILLTGGAIITGEDYPTAVVDFARDPSMQKVLVGAARWGQPGVSPVADLEEWLDEQATLSGAAPSHVVFDKLSWRAFAVDPALKTKLDITTGQGTSAVNLGFAPGAPGSPVYKGRIGTVELYVYNDTYEDVDGTIKQLIPDNTLIIGAPAAYEGTPTYGAILDPRAGYVPTPWFPKNWIDDNPAAEWVMTQSAGLLIPKRANCSTAVTVA